MPIVPTPTPAIPSAEVELPTATATSEDTESTAIEDDPRNIPVYEDDSSIVCHLVDTNLFSGSSDIFRTNVGGYFFNTVNTSGSVVLSFSSFYKDMESGISDEYRPLNQYIESLRSYSALTKVAINTGEETDKIVPHHKFVVAVDGKPDQILSDKFWQTLWLGGIFNDVEYEAIFNNNSIFDDYFSVYAHPYSTIAREYLTNPAAIASYMDISYDYNMYLKKYQEYAMEGTRSEKQLPNVHLNTWVYLYNGGHEDESTAEATPEMPTMIQNFVSRDSQIEDYQSVLEANTWSVSEAAPEGAYTGETSAEFINYINETIPTTEIAEKTHAWAAKSFENIFFNDGYFNTIYPEVLNLAPHYPYYVKLITPTETQGFVGSIIANAKFSSRMLRILKEVFGRETNVPITKNQFEKNTKYLTSSVGSESNIPISETQPIELENVDLFDMLLYSYKKIRSNNNNFLIVDEPGVERASTYDRKGAYRHLNTSNTLEVLNSVLREIDSEKGIKNIRSLLNVQRNTPDEPSPVNTPETKYSEVIAYRIEKKANRSTGRGQQSSVPIQNFWFFNSVGLNELEFFDTQVKYDTEYTYNIYQYRLVQGLKYKYSKLQLSRVIGMPNSEMSAMEAETDPTAPDYVPEFYCIEYYDPYTDAAVNDLLQEGVYEYTDAGDLSSLANDSVRIATSRDPGDSKRPYFANFVVTTQPSLKIFEIPYMTKTLKVLDHPPNKLYIEPSYVEDSSNRILFELYYETFDDRAAQFPTLITSGDILAKEQYLNANNLLENGILKKESVSSHAQIEVYRINKRPTSFRDFEDGFRHSINLKMDVSENFYTGGCIYDTIPSGKKFYYAFRVLNENGQRGQIKEIVEVEYINDGGYKYAVFNVLYEEELSEAKFNSVSIDAQKVVQLTPNIQQSILNTDDTDFQNPAINELTEGKVRLGVADDLIWEKTFKIRMTSKKTGKKLDLNVTYKQNNDILGTE
jgi:hypothetical protein